MFTTETEQNTLGLIHPNLGTLSFTRNILALCKTGGVRKEVVKQISALQLVLLQEPDFALDIKW